MAENMELADAQATQLRDIADDLGRNYPSIMEALEDQGAEIEAILGMARWRSMSLLRQEQITDGQAQLLDEIDMDPTSEQAASTVTAWLDGFMVATGWQRKLAANQRAAGDWERSVEK